VVSTPAALEHGPRRHVRHVGRAQRALGAAAAAALGVDAYVHLHDAGFYDSVRTSVLSQGTLFRAEAIVSIAIALAVALRPRPVWWAAALAVLASAAGAVVLYTYVNVGALGPLPNMYEPTWVLPGKLVSAWVEAAGALIAAIGLLTAVHRHANAVPRGGPAPTLHHAQGDQAA
jgi:hypothetical protein